MVLFKSKNWLTLICFFTVNIDKLWSVKKQDRECFPILVELEKGDEERSLSEILSAAEIDPRVLSTENIEFQFFGNDYNFLIGRGEICWTSPSSQIRFLDFDGYVLYNRTRSEFGGVTIMAARGLFLPGGGVPVNSILLGRENAPKIRVNLEKPSFQKNIQRILLEEASQITSVTYLVNI